MKCEQNAARNHGPTKCTNGPLMPKLVFTGGNQSLSDVQVIPAGPVDR
jgi:hypothetical protein